MMVLLGEAAMRHKSNEGRWGEVPKIRLKDTHLSNQLTLPPLSTGPDQTHNETNSDLAIRATCFYYHAAVNGNGVWRRRELYSHYKRKVLREKSKIIN